MPTFIGVDLAWHGNANHTGVAVLNLAGNGVQLSALSADINTIDQVVDFVASHLQEDTVIAIDAPLILVNSDRQRPCELEISRRFGHRHASAHSTNLTLYPNPTCLSLATKLEQLGFSHCKQNQEGMRNGKWFFEVYPHPAQLVLFDLQEIICYKKGAVAERRQGLRQLQKAIGTFCNNGDPYLEQNDLLSSLLGRDPACLRGRGLKHHEDLLDATFCAYLAAYFWQWGMARNEMIGDLATGYIINPLTRENFDRNDRSVLRVK